MNRTTWFSVGAARDARTTVCLAMTSIIWAVLVSCSSAGSNPSTAIAVASPTVTAPASTTPDSVTRNYVVLVHNFWVQEQAADIASNGSNVAARVCLGTDPPGTPTRLQLVDPTLCRERAVALLAVHQRFLSDLATTPPPPQFAVDDRVFRAQLPKTISDLNALISAAHRGSQNAVFEAATTYNNDMFPAVTDALNDVDPSVHHP